MAFPIREALQSAARYLSRNPRTLPALARHALRLRIAVPLDAFRWLIANLLTAERAPKEVTLSAQPPSLGVSAKTRLMGQEIRVACAVRVEEVTAAQEELRLAFRLEDLRIEAPTGSPLQMLLASGAVDLKKPADLLTFMGSKRPQAIVDASGDRFVLDLLRFPGLGGNAVLQRALRTVSPVLTVTGLRTEGDLLLLELRAHPTGLRQALVSLRPS